MTAIALLIGFSATALGLVVGIQAGGQPVYQAGGVVICLLGGVALGLAWVSYQEERRWR